MDLKTLQTLYPGTNWKKHPDGGGWVQDTAKVDPTAYIGLDAVVSGFAEVQFEAAIGTGCIIKGNVIVGSGAIVVKGCVLDGNIQIPGGFFVEVGPTGLIMSTGGNGFKLLYFNLTTGGLSNGS